MPITGLRGLTLTSSTGARFMLNPSSFSACAWAFPASYASGEERVAPSAMFPGSTTAPSLIRTTLPPSWSTAMKGGIQSASSSRRPSLSLATCSAPVMLRLNRHTPPTWRPRTSSTTWSSTSVAPKPTINSWPTFCCSVIRWSQGSGSNAGRAGSAASAGGPAWAWAWAGASRRIARSGKALSTSVRC